MVARKIQFRVSIKLHTPLQHISYTQFRQPPSSNLHLHTLVEVGLSDTGVERLSVGVPVAGADLSVDGGRAGLGGEGHELAGLLRLPGDDVVGADGETIVVDSGGGGLECDLGVHVAVCEALAAAEDLVTGQVAGDGLGLVGGEAIGVEEDGGAVLGGDTEFKGSAICGWCWCCGDAG